MTGWQTPDRKLTRILSNLLIDDVATFGAWIIKRESTAVFRVWYRGVSASIETFSAKHWTGDLIVRIVQFILTTDVIVVDDVIQVSMFPGFVPDIVAQVARVITKTRQRITKAVREWTRKLHKIKEPTLTIDELPLFAWRPPPAGQRVA